MALSTCCAVGHIISRRVGAAGEAAFYRRVANPHGTASSTFCRYQQKKDGCRHAAPSTVLSTNVYASPASPALTDGADKVGFLLMSAGKRRASPFSAVDRLISWCVTGVDDYCWCASVTSHHGPAKPAFCRYRQEKLVSYKIVTIHVHLLVQTGSICGDICEEVACCGN